MSKPEKDAKLKAISSLLAVEAMMMGKTVMEVMAKPLLDSPVYSLASAIGGGDSALVSTMKARVTAEAAGVAIAVVASQIADGDTVEDAVTADTVLFAALFSAYACPTVKLTDRADDPLEAAHKSFEALKGYRIKTVVDECPCAECAARREAQATGGEPPTQTRQ